MLRIQPASRVSALFCSHTCAIVLLLIFLALGTGAGLAEDKAPLKPCPVPAPPTPCPVPAPPTPCPVPAPKESSGRGSITVGCPKIWRSERVATVLDGMLRDLDSITVKALQSLDPNSTNFAEIETILNDLQVAAKYDQASAVTSALALQKIQATRNTELANYKSLQESNAILVKRRAVLNQELLDLQVQEAKLVQQGLQPDDPKLKAIHDQQAKAKADMDQIDAALAKPTISDVPASSLSPAAPPEAKPASAAAAIPDELKKSVKDALAKPTLPPTMLMDNVIELLHERLARQFAVMYDDLSRQSGDYDIYLVEFDIGIVPRNGAKDRLAQVKLHFEASSALAYELYPSTSSYNIMRAMDKTNHLGITGIFQSLFGFGLSVAFNREHNQLRSGLSQSLYVSGFGTGTSDFGWLIAPAPFDNFVTPGVRMVHALIQVPKKADGTSQNQVTLTASYCWPTRETRYQWFWESKDDGCDSAEKAGFTLHLPKPPALHISRVSYIPVQLDTTRTNQTNTVQLTFAEPIDPNLTITVADKLISRVRDYRGRALYGAATTDKLAGTETEQKAVASSRFGLLERDSFDPDTWVQLNSKSLLLNIALTTAGTDTFPPIRLADPGSEGAELTEALLKYLSDCPKDPKTKTCKHFSVRVGEWRFTRPQTLPSSAFLPLFYQPYDPGRIKVYVDSAMDKSNQPDQVLIVSERLSSRPIPPWLHEEAQVVLQPIAPGAKTPPEPYALDCNQREGTLMCTFPDLTSDYPEGINHYDWFKIWLDQPPYLGRPGLWAESDISKLKDKPWIAEPAPEGNWYVYEISTPGGKCNDNPWTDWKASIDLNNLGTKAYCVDELKEVAQVLEESAKGVKPIAKCGEASPQQQFAAEVKQLPTSQQKYALITGSGAGAPQCDTHGVPVKQTASGIELQIPFFALSAIPNNLHLQANDDKCKNDHGPFCRITLPDIHSFLMPGPVVLMDTGQGNYRLTGDRLRAVDHIVLVGSTASSTVRARVGFNNVDFTLPQGKGKLAPGTYNVFLLIGATTVPAETRAADKKLVQLSIAVPEENKPSPKPAGQPAAQHDSTTVSTTTVTKAVTTTSDSSKGSSGQKK